MSPLMLVNWKTVSVRFTALMWVIALVLALAIFVSVAPTERHEHHPPRTPAASSTALDGWP
jgi:hypothetical protein